MLEIKNLFAGYGETKVLFDVDLIVGQKEIVALVGPNGCGKTTILKSIFGIADVESGSIKFNNENIKKIKTHELISKGISYVPQGRIVFEELTIEENLKIGARMIIDTNLIEHRLKEVYDFFPALVKKQKKLGFELSGGQRQMLALGRALMSKPELLMLDEPSIGLSPKLQKELFKLIRNLRETGISILVVEQNAKLAIESADRTYLLENGKIALTGGKEIVKNSKIKEVYLGG